MSTPARAAFARRMRASPPGRILVLGFVLLVMMGLSDDVMRSFAADPVKAAAHVIALAIAGCALYLAHSHVIERRAAVELSASGMGRQLGIGLLVGAGLYATCEGSCLTGGSFGVESSVLALVWCTSTGIVMLVMSHRRGLVVPPRWKRTG